MPHPLDAHALPGIGPLRLTRLAEAGIDTLEDLLAAHASDLAALSGFNASVVDRARAAAAAVVTASAGSPVPELVELDDGPLPPPELPHDAPADDTPAAPPPSLDRSGPRLKRGLDAARRVEATLEWVGRARDHAAGVARNRPRKRLRRQLRKLAEVFVEVQHQAISRGASSSAIAELLVLLDRVEGRLKGFVAGTPTTSAARKLRRRMRSARKELARRIR